jgi:CheY-like chemotaxis protein
VKLRALLVDDNDEFVASANRLLESRGIEVVGYAKNGSEALRLAAAHEPHLAFVDIERLDRAPADDTLKLAAARNEPASAPGTRRLAGETHGPGGGIVVRYGSNKRGATR